MLGPQVFLLKLLGIIPLVGSDGKRCISAAVSTVVGVCYLIGTFYSAGINGAHFLYGFFHPDAAVSPKNTTHESVILQIMQLMPFFVINSRAFCVLLLLFVKRNSWPIFTAKIDRFLEHSLPTEISTVFRLNVGRTSVVLCAVTFCLHLLWEAVEWVVYLEAVPNITMTTDNFMAPLPVKYLTYQSIVLWTLFSTLAFILSQQIFVCAIVLATLLKNILRRLNVEITEELLYFGRKSEDLYGPNEKEILATVEKLRCWEARRMEALLFCGEMNDFFGPILLLIYGMDFLTLLGFSSNIVNNPRTDLDSYMYLALSCALFLAYLTVFSFPMVAVHETSGNLAFLLHRLTFAVEVSMGLSPLRDWTGRSSHAPLPAGIRLIKKLKQFEKGCRRYVCTLSGSGVIHYTRTFLVGTCTFVLSFMVLAREFFVKEQVASVIVSYSRSADDKFMTATTFTVDPNPHNDFAAPHKDLL
ncbi:hypothetical protein BV898_06131 [Hypsibius exemplaris]|uniref:Gustatory receptor n=1 Tax=Hypsibius exemplaris TaxID=2072580 RepID=A0A1W0WXC5_HYPEX|nr:hypothetical protein BV898_06131 [Hypsibius exemplaris]